MSLDKHISDENDSKSKYNEKRDIVKCIEISKKLSQISSKVKKIVNDENFLDYYKQLTELFNNLGKNSKHVWKTEGFVYLTMVLYYDINNKVMTQTQMRNILEIPTKSFTRTLNYLIKDIAIDKEFYREKIIKYSITFLEFIEKKYKLSLETDMRRQLLNQCRDFYNLLRSVSITVNKKNQYANNNEERLRDYICQYGFDIQELFKKNWYKFFLPQYMALFFVGVTLKQKVSSGEIQLENKLNAINMRKIGDSLDIPHKTIELIFRLFRATITLEYNILLRYNTIETEEIFIEQLKNIIRDDDKIDAETILELFKITKLTPERFVKTVIPYRALFYPHDLLRYLKLIGAITEISYKRIKRNILEHQEIDNESKVKAEKYIDEFIMTKILPLRHKDIPIEFIYRLKRLAYLKDIDLKEKLYKHIKNIEKGNYPIGLFNDKMVCSASKFCIRGETKEWVRTKVIRKRLVNPLKELNKIITTNPLAEDLKSIAKDKRIKFRKKYGKEPKHPPIQKRTYKLLDNIICIEQPIWYRNTNTGHIDLTALDTQKITIIEYKRKRSEVYKGIIQACLYGYFFSKTLNIEFSKLECIIYNSEIALIFNPSIIEDILQFIRELNKSRKNRILIFNDTCDLEEELVKIMS